MVLWLSEGLNPGCNHYTSLTPKVEHQSLRTKFAMFQKSHDETVSVSVKSKVAVFASLVVTATKK